MEDEQRRVGRVLGVCSSAARRRGEREGRHERSERGSASSAEPRIRAPSRAAARRPRARACARRPRARRARRRARRRRRSGRCRCCCAASFEAAASSARSCDSASARIAVRRACARRARLVEPRLDLRAESRAPRSRGGSRGRARRRGLGVALLDQAEQRLDQQPVHRVDQQQEDDDVRARRTASAARG